MDEANQLEVAPRDIQEAFSLALQFGGYSLQWLLLALVFVPLFFWIVRSKTSLPWALILVGLCGAMFFGACVLVDVGVSFGEAFGGGVQHHRALTWHALTAITTAISGWCVWKRRR